MVARLILGGAALAFLVGAAAIPDDRASPGVSATVDRAVICGKANGRTYTQRHRSGTVERSLHCPQGWQADHRCPLSAGCADVKANLWCQPPDSLVAGHLGWKAKDRLDDWAWNQLCRQHADPIKVQRMFLAPADWRQSCREAGLCR